MKRYFGLIITLVVVLSSGASYGEDKLHEVIVKGTIPAEWGTLRSAATITTGDGTAFRLFFEDSKGTIRTTVYALEEKQSPTDTAFVVRSVGVIKRSK